MRLLSPAMLVAAAALAGPLTHAAHRQAAASITLQGSTAYVEPDPEHASAQIGESGVTRWDRTQERIAWYVRFRTPGDVTATLRLRLAPAAHSAFRLAVAQQAHEATVAGTGAPCDVPLGTYRVNGTGYTRFELSGLSRSTADFGDIDGLTLSGAPARDAQFNREPRRNASSVHLIWQPPTRDGVRVFTNEITARRDPLWTYYCACGFSRGYLGMQVNGPHERRIIFSVWDAGSEAVDRSRVRPDNRVELLAKGAAVFASGFGNEGTGGHSHLVYPWKRGVTYRFAVTAQPDGPATVYTGWFYNREEKRWTLIASFRAPKDGGLLRGLYSFDEDFAGENGFRRRAAVFGPAHVLSGDGTWTQVATARFSHDPTGNLNRSDYDAEVSGAGIVLATGGFGPRSLARGTSLRAAPAGLAAPAPPLDGPPRQPNP